MTARLRSKALSPDLPQYYMRRAFLKSMGATDADLEKPLVAIANTWNEILPGSHHLDRIAAAVKRGIREAGGMATIFNVLAPCDGQGSGNEGFKYVLPSRDLIAASVEMMIEHASYDAAVMIGTCDKIVPGSSWLPPAATSRPCWSPAAICLQAVTEGIGSIALPWESISSCTGRARSHSRSCAKLKAAAVPVPERAVLWEPPTACALPLRPLVFLCLGTPRSAPPIQPLKKWLRKLAER